MHKLRRSFRQLLKRKIVPASIYGNYFEQQLPARQQLLDQILNSGKDLLDRLPAEKRDYWADRIHTVMASPDNDAIARVPDAGQLIDGQLIMHNGIKVNPLSYYSYPMLKMLMDNGGVHEPQEELVFQEVLASLPKRKNKTILELGAYWAFYSMWFQKTFPDARCLMVEPDRQNLFFGKENFRLNELQGTFLHYGIGQKPDLWQNITTVDTICRNQHIDFVDILHSDIQGFELQMLHGAERLLQEKRVGYAFISTHSNQLHEDCQSLLSEKYNFHTVASANVDESYSWDGILVMKAPDYPGIDRVAISRKKNETQ